MGGGLHPTVATDLLQASWRLRVLPLPDHRRPGCRDGVGSTDTVSVRPRLVDYPATVIPTIGAFRCLPPIDPRNGAL
jgi:hypothetical protein